MGLLNSSMLAAMQAPSVAYRQVWVIGRPPAAGSTAYDFLTIHDDATSSKRVVDPGERETEAYNQTLADPGRMPTGLYTIVCANGDGLLYTTTPGNFWYVGTSGYQADPIECMLYHYCYVRVNGAWTLLDMIIYRGKVTAIEYSGRDKTATITAQAAVMQYMDRQWVDEDGVLYEPDLEVYASSSGPA